MKKKSYLLVALILALILSGGLYAFTYTTTSATIPIASPTGDTATVNATVTQPNWSSVLTLTPSGAETLRPNGAGDTTNISAQTPATGAHWEKVDDVTADGDSTYVVSGIWEFQEDLYNITDHSVGSGKINYVTVYMVCRSVTVGQANAYILVKTLGNQYKVAEVTTSTSYATYSYTFYTSPLSGTAWTWGEIDTLQAGIGLRRSAPNRVTYCTQVYVEVNYGGGIALQGNTPTGPLFTVTPNTGYNGDLAVNVYLVNTGNLTQAYQYLNMNLYLEGSEEAGQTPNYKTLTLANGAIAFRLTNSGGITRTLSVTGGSYGVVSDNTSNWSSGWTVTPQFYCEATQR